MTLIELLKAKWSIYGLDAPIFAWVAAAGLLAGTLFFLVRLWWLVHREARIHRNATKRLEALRAEHPASPGEGLSGPAYDAIVQVFEEILSLTPAWRSFNSQILGRRDTVGNERFWASESAEGAFSDAAVVEPRLNRSFFMAVPGIVTGTGLLFTFLAILVALLEVKLWNRCYRDARTRNPPHPM